MQDETTQVMETADIYDAAWADDSNSAEVEVTEEAANQQPEPDTEEEQNEATEDTSTAESPVEEASTEPAPEAFTLKYMKEDKQYSRDETIALAQKGLDYDRIRADRDSIRAELPELRDYKGFLEELAAESKVTVDQLIEDVRANLLIERERAAGHAITDTAAREQIRREKLARQQDNTAAPDPEPEVEAPKNAGSTADKSMDVQAFCKAFPGVGAKDIPQSVWEEVRGGSDLTSAYTRYENKQLRAQIEAMQQNEKNKNRSTGSRKSSGNSQASIYDQAWDAADY